MTNEEERSRAWVWLGASGVLALLAGAFAAALIAPLWRLAAPLPGEAGWVPGFSFVWGLETLRYFAALPLSHDAWAVYLWQMLVTGPLAAGAAPHPLAFMPPAVAAAAAGFGALVNPHELRLKGHGDARLASGRDLAKAGLLGPTGLILGQYGGRYIRMPETLSAILIAPPGSGKTAGIAIPNLVADWPDYRPFLGSLALGAGAGRALKPASEALEWTFSGTERYKWLRRAVGRRCYCRHPSFICNDPKGELFAKTSAHWRRRGFNVVKLAWAEATGQRCNPLSPDMMPGGRRVPQIRGEILQRLGEVYVEPAAALTGMLKLARDYTDWQARLAADPAAVDATALSVGVDVPAARTAIAAVVGDVVELIKLYADREQYVRRLWTILVDERIEPHWRDKGRAAGQGFSLFTIYRAERLGQEPSFGRMIDYMTDDRPLDHQGAGENDDATMQMLRAWIEEAQMHGYPSRVVTELTLLAAVPGRERGSILSTMDGGIDVFKLATVRDRTAACDFGLDDIRYGAAPTIVYLVVPLEDAAALGKVSGVFFESAAARFISQPESEIKRRGRPVVFVADEFWTLPSGMESLMQIPALGRGQQVQLLLIGQAYNQIALKINREAVGILRGATASQIILQQNDHETAKVVSDIVGAETVRTESVSRQQGLGSQVQLFAWSSSVQTTGRPLLTVQRLMSLERWNEQVVLFQGMANRPVLCRTPGYFRDRALKRRVEDRQGFVANVESGLSYKDALARLVQEAERNAALAASVAREAERVRVLNVSLPPPPEAAGRIPPPEAAGSAPPPEAAGTVPLPHAAAAA